MSTHPLSQNDFARKAIKGYRRLSMGIVVSAGILLILLFYFQLFGDLNPLHHSISHYYHEDGKFLAMQSLERFGYNGIRLGDLLVGTLSAIAVFLFWFSGFSKWEDRLLSAGGAMLLGVAWIPTQRAQELCEPAGISAHFVFAILFFVSILLVATVFAHKREAFSGVMAGTPSFQRWFAFSAALMVVVPLLIWLVSMAGGCSYFPSWVFWAEWTAILFFGVYWAGKMFEFNRALLASQASLQGLTSSWWAR
ncbi:MAG: hypothetical protein ABJN35_05995 [Erythrobacter sp.]